MGRMERFAQYEFAAWPDEGLLDQVKRLERPGILRVEQKFSGEPALLVEIGDAAYSPDSVIEGEDGEWHASPNGTPERVRLS